MVTVLCKVGRKMMHSLCQGRILNDSGNSNRSCFTGHVFPEPFEYLKEEPSVHLQQYAIIATYPKLDMQRILRAPIKHQTKSAYSGP